MDYDLDRIDDRIDGLRELRSDLRALAERADEMGVELDEVSLSREIRQGERLANALREADRDALKRLYEEMSL